MQQRFSVKSPLLRGPTASAWVSIFIALFFPLIPLSALWYFVGGAVPRQVSVAGSILLAAIVCAWAPSWFMMFFERNREKRAGYTTLPADEGDRDLDEVDPSTGLIIRLAGDTPLTKPERRVARTEARAQARRLVASGASYELPFGWIKPRPR